jgi:uncharacterized membrane protein
MAAQTTTARPVAGLSAPLLVAGVAALVGIVAFFLPWFTFAGTTYTGLTFASVQAAAYLALIAGLGAVVAVGFVAAQPEARGRATMWLLAASGIGVIITLAYLATTMALAGNDDALRRVIGLTGFGGAQVGVYLSLVAYAVAVIAAAVASTSEGAPTAGAIAAAEAEYPVVRRVVVAGLLGAIAILLGVTRIGFIPFPTGVNATIMHIPAIIGGVAEGWIVGWAIGTIFGVFSFLNATTPMFKDPIVAILPRMCIGITSYFTFRALAGLNYVLALIIAAAVGTLTNTILVLGLGTLRGYLTPELAVTIALTNGLPEVVVAAILIVPVIRAVKGVGGPRKSSL